MKLIYVNLQLLYLFLIILKLTLILQNLKKRPNFNKKLHERFRKLQLPLDYKLKRSNFIIKNNFSKKSVKKDIENILEKICQ